MNPAAFQPTRWTLVLEARGRSPAARAALTDLCEHYYAPVLGFLKVTTTETPDTTPGDLANAFFESVLAGDLLKHVDPERGRFRSYLLGALKHFLANRRAAARTQKRGGGAPHIPVEDAPDLPADQAEPAATFDQAWAFTAIARALERTGTEMAAAGKTPQFETLKPWLDGTAPCSVPDAAEALGLTENATRVAVHRLRERFRANVRDEVAATVSDPADLEDELHHLVSIVSRGNAPS